VTEQQAELELIRKAAQGDPVAQERFILSQRPVLLRYLERHVPDDMRTHLDPQDVYQDVCFDIFRRMSTFQTEDPRMAVRWVLRIARNRVIDLVRQHKTARRGGGDVVHLDSNEKVGEDSVVKLLQQLAVYSRTPSRSAVSHELIAALEKSLARIPEHYRNVVRARYIEGKSISDVAREFGRSDGATQMLCRRGLEALQLELRSFSRYI
jgi:RNA polymerase sigma factor (sigma-70 family)